MNRKFGFALILICVGLFIFSCQNKNKYEADIFKGDLFDDSHLHVIRMQFADENFWDTLVSNKKQKDSIEVNRYLKCYVSIDGTELKDIGLRLKGESSYDFTKGKKKSFKLDLNSFVKKQKYCGVSRINLNNNYKDPTFMREKLMLDILSKENLPAPRSAYAKVYLNDEYWGVYLMVEGINKTFLNRTFNNANGNLYFGEPNGTLEKQDIDANYYRNYRKKNHKKSNNWNDLIQFINTINATDADSIQVAALDSLFNLDNCLKTWALTNLFVNVDAYNMMYPHNYFLYFDSTANKFQWINYDYNYSFAAWNPKFTYKEVCDFPIYYCNEKLPLANLILSKNKLLKKRYHDIYTHYLDKHLTEKDLSAEIAKQFDLIKNAVLEDNLKEYSNEDFEKNCKLTLGDKNDPGAYIPGLLEFLRDRRLAVLKQLEDQNTIN